jgi:preprotein translocase subunit SecG
MENVILTIHLLLVLTLIGVVLLQRSEGGGLGMGGGGGGAMSGRSAATALGKLTWILGFGLFATSITLTIIAAQNAAGSSVLDRLVDAPAPVVAPQTDVPADAQLPGTGTDTTPQTPAAD